MKNATHNRISRLLPLIVLVGLASPAFPVSAGVNTWTTNGPEGGDVRALAIDPANPATLYAGTSRGGVFKTTNGGGRWAATNAGLTNSFVYSLAVDPSAPATLYAGTYYGGIFKSTNGGESWTPMNAGLSNTFVLSLAVDPSAPAKLYAGTDYGGIFKSTNAGESWTAINAGLISPFVSALAIDPSAPSTLYAGTSGGVFKSSNGGGSWTAINAGLPDTVVWALAIDPSTPATLYAGTQGGVFKSTNGGGNWTAINAGLTRTVGRDFPEPVLALAIDSSTPATLYAGTQVGVFKSSNGGGSWTPMNAGLTSTYVFALAIDRSTPATLYAGTYLGGVFKSNNAGGSWSAINAGLTSTFVPSVAIDPTDPEVVFAATSLGIYESRDGGESWNEPVRQSPAANVVAIDPSNHSTLYAAGSGVYKSIDGGRSWQDGRLADYIYDLVIDPNNPRRILASSGSVYRSLDGADSWSRVMTPDDDYSSYYGPTVNAIAIAPSDSATIYAGGCCGAGFVYRSDDGGDNWSDLKTNIGSVNALAVDPGDPRIVYAGTYRNGIIRSDDGGVSWSQPQLSGMSVFAFAVDPRHPSSLFAGTSSGLFWTNDSGASWTQFDPVLTEAVHSIALDPSGGFLYAGTERGAFSLRSFERCRNGPDRLCLIGARFQVALTARDPRTGAPITGRAIEEGDRFGYFSFPDLTGDPDFPEVLIKMVDATGLPAPYGGHVWVFHSALTDLDYTLTVQDTQTGRVKTYHGESSEPGSSSLTCGEADTSAFAREAFAYEANLDYLREDPSASMPGARLTVGSGTELSLLGGRFRATLRARDPRTDRIADGTALPRADGFGYFSLPAFTGDPSFPEVFVKMIDATALSGGYFWFFHTGLTDLEYTLTVSDRVTGAARTYTGGATDGARLCGEADTMAF